MMTRSILLGAAALAFACAASALPITGVLALSGSAQLDSAMLSVATKVQSWGTITVSTPIGVTPGSVLDSTINPGDAVTMAAGEWIFTGPKTALWSVGGFTFDLDQSWIVFQSDNFISVQGSGLVRGNGYDPTKVDWFFTSQGHGIANNTFSVSATTSPLVAVPDATHTAVLLMAGLCALAATRFRSGWAA